MSRVIEHLRNYDFDSITVDDLEKDDFEALLIAVKYNLKSCHCEAHSCPRCESLAATLWIATA